MSDNRTSNHQLGPREPRNDMVICPNCTCQFGAISVDDQKERSRMEAEIERLRAANEKARQLLTTVLSAYDSLSPDELVPDILNDNDMWDAVRVELDGPNIFDDVPPAETTPRQPERPFAWYREGVFGPMFHKGDWPPPEPDDTVWQPLYSSPEGRPAVETAVLPAVPGLPKRLRKMCSPSSATPTDLTLLEAATQLDAAVALLRRWRKRETDLGMRARDPDGRLFSESGWFCSLIENSERIPAVETSDERPTVVSDSGLCRESAVREFLGWLSGHIPELHKVEVPRLAAAWDEYKRIVEAAARDGAFL
jgi:hypothetical protein